MPSKSNKQLRGHSSQFFVAGELCRRGVVAVVTMGNCPNTDILCSDLDGKKFAHVQVKTFVPGIRTCPVGEKAEKNYGPNFFWVLGGIPAAESDDDFVFYVIPSPVMSRETRKEYLDWLRTPGRNGQKHQPCSTRNAPLPPHINSTGWDIAEYKNRWDLILNQLT
jgi:hypothetical protein